MIIPAIFLQKSVVVRDCVGTFHTYLRYPAQCHGVHPDPFKRVARVVSIGQAGGAKVSHLEQRVSHFFR